MTPGPRRFGFAVLPGHSLLGCSAAIEALAAANDVLGEARYESTLLSLDGRHVAAACGTRVLVHCCLTDAPTLHAALVVSEGLPASDASGQPDGAVTAVTAWLRAQAQARALLGGLGCGAAWLAEAGLLGGYRATVHHAQVTQVGERHPQTVFSSNVYEIDRDRISCGPGTASLDLMLAWLAREHGDGIVAPLLAHFGLERLRARDERQRVPAAALVTNAKVTEALALMQANLQEPLPTDDIARLVGVSRRQLERLFKQHLDDMPSRYYIELRLMRARHLLRHSGQSILQIGLACGFASASRFSSGYRARFGHTPRDERSARAADWKAQRDPAAGHQPLDERGADNEDTPR
ncbi:GlxA family transcriptional regulator [Rubrivivax albus]|uniref:Helix-turn-helix domain-containing protein n=1 Tax=Rubrivivax albus TaxID=2499835 RepID=A0A437K0G3_9BURK|nr:helix-turn-helix domain-containing protein [Rubrivivax albus]RVT53878.1 helix-turn-helix domain-containing protein [Rubrivivax albus]